MSEQNMNDQDQQAQNTFVPSYKRREVVLQDKETSERRQAALTTDGKNLVTTARLRAEIVEAVNTAGGRASARQLGVDMGFAEATMVAAIRCFWTEDLHGRCVDCGEDFECLTDAYLAALSCEADTTAAKLGWITLNDLAAGFKLPVEFTEALVYEWMQDPVPRFSVSKSRLSNSSIVAETYATLKRDELCVACCAATEPRLVQDLMQECCIMHPEEDDFCLGLLEGLAESGRLKGSLSGGGRSRAYVPDTYVAAQHEAAHAFFSVNGYLDHATALDLNVQVRKLHAFVKDKHPTAVCLETVAVSRTVVERLEAVADGAVAEASWFEAWTVVPTALSDADAARLVGMCAACNRADGDPLGVVQLGVYGVSTRFVHDLSSLFREEVASELERASLCEDSHVSGGKVVFRVSSSGDGGSSRESDGKRRRRGASRKAGADDDSLSEGEAQRFVRCCKPELNDFPRLAEALGAHLAPAFRQVKAEEVRRASKVSGSEGFQDRAGTFEAAFERAYWDFQLHRRGVQALRQSLQRRRQQGSVSPSPTGNPDADSGVSDASGSSTPFNGCGGGAALAAGAPEEQAEEYVLRTLGAQIAEMVTARECEKLGIPFASQEAGEDRQPEQRMPVISKEASSALVEVLPTDVASSLVHLWQAASDGSHLSGFCKILEEQVFSACNLVGKRLDKRRERQLAAEKQRAMKELLFQSVSERDVFHFAALLVFRSATGGVLLLPRPMSQLGAAETDHQDSWAGVLLQAVRGAVSPEAEQCLTQLQREIEATKRVTTTAAAAAANRDGEEEEKASMESSGNAAEAGSEQESRSAVAGRESGVETGETAVARLMRSAEAARALGMACGD